jgi:2-polyprenyl-6-methoxyphenol hydroxylase-like FAD-dependent oxidoreductase
MHLGDGCTFGLVPIGAGRTYGFAYVVQPRFHDQLAGRLERLRNRFAPFGGRVPEYLASLERDDQVICSAMEWAEFEKWHTGRVVLVGDAAHASSPMMGQGGCMAMEDACVLAQELRAAATIEGALASYEKRRMARVKWVQHQSMAVGEILTVPSAVRNAVLRENGGEAMRARFGPLVPAP